MSYPAVTNGHKDWAAYCCPETGVARCVACHLDAEDGSCDCLAGPVLRRVNLARAFGFEPAFVAELEVAMCTA